jgi:hypothetical protein
MASEVVAPSWPSMARPATTTATPSSRSLAELCRFLGGERATLLGDGLPAYAPELNPTEGLWSSLKAVELAKGAAPTLAEGLQQAHRGIERVRRTPQLASSFLGHDGLWVACSSNRHPSPVQMDESTSSTAPTQTSNTGRRLVRFLSDVLPARRLRLRTELSRRNPAAIKAMPRTCMARRTCPPYRSS